jgi:hypothetical protein
MTVPRSISPSYSWSTTSLDKELTTLQQNTVNSSVHPTWLLRYELDELIILVPVAAGKKFSFFSTSSKSVLRPTKSPIK